MKSKGQVIVHCQFSKETDLISLHSSEMPFPKLFSRLQEWRELCQFTGGLSTGDTVKGAIVSAGENRGSKAMAKI